MLSERAYLDKLGRGYTLVAQILLGTVLLFIVVNLAVYTFYKNRIGSLKYGEELLRQAYPDQDKEERDAMLTETWSRPLVRTPFIHFREGPFQGQYVNVHEAGFRGTNLPWPPDRKALTIFVFGGSTTFGYGVADDETVPSYLGRLLGDRLKSRPVHTYNFGQGFYYSSQELQLFGMLLQQGYVPDVAIFIDGLNEEASIGWGGKPFQPQSFQWKDRDSALPQNLLPKLPISRLARDIHSRFQMKSNAKKRMLALKKKWRPEDVIATWKANRKIIRGIAKEFGLRALFVWQPVFHYKYNWKYHIFCSEVNRKPSKVYPLFAGQYEEWSKWDDFLWLADLQDNREELLYVDKVHQNRRFNSEIAQAIFDFLIHKGIQNW